MLKFVCLWLNQLLCQLNPLLLRKRLQELLRSDVVRNWGVEAGHGLLGGGWLKILLGTWGDHGLRQVALQLIEYSNVGDSLVEDLLVVRHTRSLLAATLHVEGLESTSERNQLLFLGEGWCWLNWGLYGILVNYSLRLLLNLWLYTWMVVVMERGLMSKVKWVIVFL